MPESSAAQPRDDSLAGETTRGEKTPAFCGISPYYEDEWITLYHGDSEHLLPQMTAAAILTDPPYGVGIKYGPGYDDSRKDYWEWLAVMVDLMRASAPLVVFSHRVAALKSLPQEWDWVCPWTKPYASGARVGNSPLLPHWEPIFLYGIHDLGVVKGQHVSDVFVDSPKKAGNVGGQIGREKWAEGQSSVHPCPKPQGLYQRLVRAFTQPDQLVLDPFAGTGTTLRAAKAMGRRSIGIEMQERYCEEIAERSSQAHLFHDETEAA